MIFSKPGHIEQIKNGEKTQTRRPSDRYQVGRSYAIQPGRTKPGIPEGRILIRAKWIEEAYTPEAEGTINPMITETSAKEEGGYTPEEYEQLYNEMYPGWKQRWAYRFKYTPTEEATV